MLLAACLVSDARAVDAIDAHRAQAAPGHRRGGLAFSNGEVQLKGVLLQARGSRAVPGAAVQPRQRAGHVERAGLREARAAVRAARVGLLCALSAWAGAQRIRWVLTSWMSFRTSRIAAIVRALPVLIVLFGVLLAVVLLTTRRQPLWDAQSAPASSCCSSAHSGFTSSVSVRAPMRPSMRCETDQFSDHLAAFEWLRRQSFVMPGRIAHDGQLVWRDHHGARRRNASPTARAGGRRRRRADVVARAEQTPRRLRPASAQAPIFFFQAENDYSLAPTEVLGKAMREAGKPSVVKIYPRVWRLGGRTVTASRWRGGEFWEAGRCSGSSTRSAAEAGTARRS